VRGAKTTLCGGKRRDKKKKHTVFFDGEKGENGRGGVPFVSVFLKHLLMVWDSNNSAPQYEKESVPRGEKKGDGKKRNPESGKRAELSSNSGDAMAC